LCFLDALLRSSITRWDKLVAATFLLALFSNQTPNLPEAYFWMVGAVTYQLGCILTLFFFTTVIRSRGKSGSARLLLTLFAGLLIVTIVGSNEIVMLVLLLIVVPITILTLKNKSTDRWHWLAYTVIALICATIVVTAPGNIARGSLFPDRHRFFY